jgi:site-specific DNA recombinase
MIDDACQMTYNGSMRTILYCRASTDDQQITLEAQRAKLEAYASLYELAVVEIIIDDGESAKSLNRPGLQRALAMLRDGLADGLAVAKLDRLTRSVADWQSLIDAYFGERAGKHLFSVADSIDTRTAAGRLVLNVLLSVAQWEREAIAERTREALQHKIKNGQRVGKVKYGYDLADDGKTLVENQAEQIGLRLIRTLRHSGQTLRAISQELTARGISTKEGGPWSHSAIQRILARTPCEAT